MADRGVLTDVQVGEIREYFSGKEFVEAVAAAGNKKTLRDIFLANGIASFTDDMLEECWKYLALSQDIKAMESIFSDMDFESCSAKLAAHGIKTTREDFDMINDILTMGQDPDFVRRLMKIETVGELHAVLTAEGYHHITTDYLEMLEDNAANLVADGILTPEEIKGTEHMAQWRRFFKVINTLFAMTAITELTLCIPGAVAPTYIIAIACGICLMP